MPDQTLATIDTVANVVFFIILAAGAIFHKLDKAKAVQKALEGAGTVLQAAEPLLATTPLGKYVHIIDEIEKAAEQGVKVAEQLASNDPAVDKKQVALDYVHNVITELGFELTDRVKAIIDGAVEGVYYSFKAWGKSPPIAATEPQQGGQTSTKNPEPAPVAAPATDTQATS